MNKKGRPFNKQTYMLVYRTMIEYQKETGFNMTYREIAGNLGYKSYSWLYPKIKWLKENGYVKTKGKQVHAIPREVN